MNGLRLICLSVGFLGLIATAVSQDLNELRPQIRYPQDFEQLAEGSEDVGSVPVEVAWTQGSGEATIQSGFGEELAGKQLVVTGDSFVWVSP